MTTCDCSERQLKTEYGIAALAKLDHPHCTLSQIGVHLLDASCVAVPVVIAVESLWTTVCDLVAMLPDQLPHNLKD